MTSFTLRYSRSQRFVSLACSLTSFWSISFVSHSRARHSPSLPPRHIPKNSCAYRPKSYRRRPHTSPRDYNPRGCVYAYVNVPWSFGIRSKCCITLDTARAQKKVKKMVSSHPYLCLVIIGKQIFSSSSHRILAHSSNSRSSRRRHFVSLVCHASF